MDMSFNIHWCEALGARDHENMRATHWLKYDPDISVNTPIYWLDTLLLIMESRRADIVSAITPIKDPQFIGLTSTAVDNPTGKGWDIERRLTMDEIYRILPETFGNEVCPGRRLLVNNSLMLVDLRGEWCDNPNVLWHSENGIERTRRADGSMLRKVRAFMQDWYFSRVAQDAGAELVVTRQVTLLHYSAVPTGYTSSQNWGSWTWDEEYAKGPIKLPQKEIGSIESLELVG
jgi:hypothetical protein